MDDRLVIGASLYVSEVADHLNWLLEAQRPLELQDATSPDILDGAWRSVAREGRSLLDGHTGPLGIHGTYNGLILHSHDSRAQALARDRLLQCLDFAAEAGATHMVVHSPFVSHGGPHSVVLTDVILDCAHTTLRAVAQRAQAQHCLLVFEVVYDLHTAPLIGLIRSFQSEWVRLSLDVGHARAMQTQGGPSPDAWIADAGHLLAHLHVHDNDGQRDRHWPPGAGTIVWRAIFEALRPLTRPPYHPRLILEVKPPETIAAAAWLADRGYVR